jgi:hypothetical protein
MNTASSDPSLESIFGHTLQIADPEKREDKIRLALQDPPPQDADRFRLPRSHQIMRATRPVRL